MRLLLSLLLLLPAAGARGGALPAGLCPFDAKRLPLLFSDELRSDFGDEFLRESFQRRERWYGSCEEPKPLRGRRFLFPYDSAEIPVRLELKDGKVALFGFEQARHKSDSWKKLADFLGKNWPRSAFFVSDAGDEHGLRDKAFVPVGEGRVLLLLAALEEEIAAGRLSNEQKVRLQAGDKAQELDELAEEKPGKQLTVAELKERILTRFDRTAADILLRLLGRGRFEEGREPASPFLSRREFGWLMTLPAPQLTGLSRHEARKKAEALDRPGKIPPVPAERYDHLGKIEWLATPREICAALGAIARVPQVSQSLPSRQFRKNHPGWKIAAYYAARDTGLALTTWIATLPGRTLPTCFTLQLEDDQFLDEGIVEELLERMQGLLDPPPGSSEEQDGR